MKFICSNIVWEATEEKRKNLCAKKQKVKPFIFTHLVSNKFKQIDTFL